MSAGASASGGAAAVDAQGDALRGYYRLHARVYDATRWSFLFGRGQLIDTLARDPMPVRRILEIGCGTGWLLSRLAWRFPGASLTGVDLSSDMLVQARKRLQACPGRCELRCEPYSAPLEPGGFDLIVLSYALSMMNPGFDAVLDAAASDLAPGGRIAVVDFHDTPIRTFRRWMGLNHVRMEGQLRPALAGRWRHHELRLLPAWLGLWRRIQFIGVQRSG